MMDNLTINKTFIATSDTDKIVKGLLSTHWIKKKELFFRKDRKNYFIEVDGSSHPIWKISITPLNDQFDENDWKLLKDFREINTLGEIKEKKLYLNDATKSQVELLLHAMTSNDSNVIFNDEFIILRDGSNYHIMKIAAKMEVKMQNDGWYIGNKKIL